PGRVHPHLCGTALRRQRLITSKHHRPNHYHLNRQNLLSDTWLQNLLEPDNSDNLPVPRHSQRRISPARDPIHQRVEIRRDGARDLLDRVGSTLDYLNLILSDYGPGFLVSLKLSPQPPPFTP